MTKVSEPQAVREVHEIRERLHEQRKDWTAEQKREHLDRVAEEYAQKYGLRRVRHDAPQRFRKHG